MIQEEYFGFGSIANLKEIIKKESAKNIFLVTGKKSYEISGAKREIEKILENMKIRVTRFYDFSSNPKLEEIENGFDLFKEEDYECILAVGGGSAIDVAKAIKLFYFQETKNKTPLIAIPTTTGSGSEATYFIVYYIEKEKQSKGDSEITLPDYSILDSQFLLDLPKKIASSTGMDALSQAVESYWSINSNEESKKFAEQAIRLILGNLEESVNFPSKESRENMLKAANLAGKAINISKTTACHSIAYPITSYFGVQHGHAAILTLGEMLVYNSEISEKDLNDKRGVEYVKKIIKEIVMLFGVSNPNEVKDRIKSLMESINLETKLSQLNIGEEGTTVIIDKGFNPERVKNNPRLLTEGGLNIILKEIY